MPIRILLDLSLSRSSWPNLGEDSKSKRT